MSDLQYKLCEGTRQALHCTASLERLQGVPSGWEQTVIGSSIGEAPAMDCCQQLRLNLTLQLLQLERLEACWSVQDTSKLLVRPAADGSAAKYAWHPG